MAGDEAVGAIPSAHGLTRRGQAGTEAVDPEEAVVAEGEIGSVDAVVLCLERTAGELDCAVWEFFEGGGLGVMRGVFQRMGVGEDGGGAGESSGGGAGEKVSTRDAVGFGHGGFRWNGSGLKGCFGRGE